MTPNISGRSLKQSHFKFQDGGQYGGRARLWLYVKRFYFISSVIAYCISPYASYYAGLSCCVYRWRRSDFGPVGSVDEGGEGWWTVEMR